MDGRLIQDENLKTVERAIIDLKAQSKAPSTLVAYGCDLRRLARILSDLSAIKKGTVGKRIVRRLAGKASGRLLGRLIR